MLRLQTDTASASAGEERLVMVTNRAPIEHRLDGGGRLERREAGGGVATALGAIAKTWPLTWIASPATAVDRVLAARGARVAIGETSELRFVDVPEAANHLFYEVFSNPLLWFVHHSLAQRLGSRDLEREARRSWDRGYVAVNRAFAAAVTDEVRRDGAGRVMFHDYHFYLTPRFVREVCPGVVLQQFVHIPWPTPEEWQALPADIVHALCDGLLANDSLVFQTDGSVANFLATCNAYLGADAATSVVPAEVSYRGHTTSVWNNPISVDADELGDAVESAEARRHADRLRRLTRERTIVRVDRLDPSKNIVAGFQALERLLEEEREWRGRLSFLAFLVPSRTSVPEYRSYAAEVLDAVGRVNERFGSGSWQPVSLFYEHNRLQALAAMTMYDVLLVNSLADGMNLVSKEGPVVNRRDGVLVLSETAGSFAELRRGALGVRPWDIDGTAAALKRALEMDTPERAERAERLRRAIHAHQLGDWWRHQVSDLEVAAYVRGSESGATCGQRRVERRAWPAPSRAVRA